MLSRSSKHTGTVHGSNTRKLPFGLSAGSSEGDSSEVSVFFGAQGSSHLRARVSAGIAVMGILVTAGCGGRSGGGKASVGSELAAAIQLQQQGKLAAAEALYLKITKAQPSNYFAQYDLGVIAQGRDELTQALTYYGAALTANPRYVPAMFNQATILSQSDPSNAIALYKRVIALQPVAPTAYLNLGLLENGQGQVKQGTRDIVTAIKQDPTLINKVPKGLRGLILAKVAASRGGGGSPSATPSTVATSTAAAS